MSRIHQNFENQSRSDRNPGEIAGKIRVPTDPPVQAFLFVVAHPDDEILGGGGIAGALADQGHAVTACILSSVVAARDNRPQDHELLDDIFFAAKTLGMKEPILGDFPNIQLNVIPHLDLVQFVEAAIVNTGATQIFTHHPSDLNDDHRQVAAACQAAARLPLRREGLAKLQGLHFMEVPSSTDWAFPGSGSTFLPNSFFELGEKYLELKLEALACYRGVMRAMPHPRSVEAIRGLAAVRGGQAGMIYAEAFQSIFTDLAHLGN